MNLITDCGVLTGMVLGDTGRFNQGLVFLRQGNILITGDYWTIVVDVDIKDYESAIAADRQSYVLLSEADLFRCSQGKVVICPANLAINTHFAASCEAALFLGQSEVAIRICDRRVLPHGFRARWYRSPGSGDWVYSVDRETKIVQRCRGIDGVPQAEMTLTGTGLLNGSAGCFVYADQFRLLPASNGRSQFQADLRLSSLVVIPGVRSVLHPEELNLLKDHSLHEEVLDEAPVFRGDVNTKEISFQVQALVQRLKEVKAGRLRSTVWIWSGATCAGILLAGAALALWLYFRVRAIPSDTACGAVRQPPGVVEVSTAEREERCVAGVEQHCWEEGKSSSPRVIFAKNTERD